MNIFILTVGSRGDVQPFVALGQGLKAAGHTVTLATSASFESFIVEHGLNFGRLTNELIELMDSAQGRQALEETIGIFGSIKTMVKLAKEGNRINRQLVMDSWEAAQLAKPDLIIFHPKALAGAHIAEKLRVPALLATLQPMLVPTVETPPIGIPALKLGGWYNKFSYQLIKMGYSSYRGMINTFRQETLGIDKLPKSADVLTMSNGQPLPVLHAFSQHLLPRPADWPPHAYVTGYWFLEEEQTWQPPAALRAFLDAGDPPVYVGFGSMAGRDPKRLTQIIVDALQQANVRGLLATGWGGLSAADLPATIFKIEQAPHAWLFPRVAAVVHHGGAGTTAAGLRAGRPTVICPFMGDQPFWGERVHSLGVGPKPILQKKVTVDSLAWAIRTAATDQTLRQTAAALGEKIRQEDGIANTLDLIAALTGQP